MTYPLPRSEPSTSTPPAGLAAADTAFELGVLQQHVAQLTERLHDVTKLVHQLRGELRVLQAIRMNPPRATYFSTTPVNETVDAPPMSGIPSSRE